MEGVRVGDVIREKGNVEAGVAGPETGFQGLDSEGLNGLSSGRGGRGGGDCNGDREGPENSGRGADGINREEDRDGGDGSACEVVSIGDTASECRFGTGENGEFVDRESGVIGCEIGCVRGDVDLSLASCGSRGAAIAGMIVFWVARAQHAAAAAALCVTEGATDESCFLVGPEM
jgi:hypothetical protein